MEYNKLTDLERFIVDEITEKNQGHDDAFIRGDRDAEINVWNFFAAYKNLLKVQLPEGLDYEDGIDDEDVAEVVRDIYRERFVKSFYENTPEWFDNDGDAETPTPWACAWEYSDDYVLPGESAKEMGKAWAEKKAHELEEFRNQEGE